MIAGSVMLGREPTPTAVEPEGQFAWKPAEVIPPPGTSSTLLTETIRETDGPVEPCAPRSPCGPRGPCTEPLKSVFVSDLFLMSLPVRELSFTFFPVILIAA